MMCKMKKYWESSSCANMDSSSLSGCECSQVFGPASSLTWGPPGCSHVATGSRFNPNFGAAVKFRFKWNFQLVHSVWGLWSLIFKMLFQYLDKNKSLFIDENRGDVTSSNLRICDSKIFPKIGFSSQYYRYLFFQDTTTNPSSAGLMFDSIYIAAPLGYLESSDEDSSIYENKLQHSNIQNGWCTINRHTFGPFHRFPE